MIARSYALLFYKIEADADLASEAKHIFHLRTVVYDSYAFFCLLQECEHTRTLLQTKISIVQDTGGH